jgi:C-terminal peptidase prc
MLLKKSLRFYGALARVLILALVMATWLSFPSSVAITEDTGELLQEIEECIQNYYLYPLEEEAFPLKSIEDLYRVLKDPYSFYLREEQYKLFEDSLSRTLYGVGIYLEIKNSFISVVSTVPDSPAQRAGIESGDVIIAVDGRSVARLSLEEVIALIRGEEGEKVTLTLRRQENILNFTLVREKLRLPAVEYTWEDDGIAFVRIYNFGGEAAKDMELIMEELEGKGLRGLILDLRANQGGYLNEALEMASLFSGGVLLLVRDRDSAWQEISAPGESSSSYPAVVLINGGTASAAEIFSAALKDNRMALLVGEVSFGKGTMQTIFEMEHGGYLKLTMAEFASPRGNTIEGTGVEPHFLVPAEEEQLLMALQLLRHRLEQENKGSTFLEAGLKRMQNSQGQTLSPLEIDGEIYLPLRAVLFLTGRTIQSGAEPGMYIFPWENRLYLLDIQKRFITWRHKDEEDHIYRKVFLRGGITYVPQAFLEEELGLSFL